MTPRRHPARARSVRLAVQGALIACCGLLAIACGSAAAPSASPAGGANPASPSHSAGTTAASKVRLDVTLAGANGPTQHWTLRCDPPEGNSPGMAAACSKILSSTVLRPSTHMHFMCPMIMANARVYTITGVVFGKRVRQTIVDGGCDIGRYATLHHIFN